MPDLNLILLVLVGLPFAAGFLCLALPFKPVRVVLVFATCLALATASVLLIRQPFVDHPGDSLFGADLRTIIQVADFLLLGLILFYGLLRKSLLVLLTGLAQAGLLVYLEFFKLGHGHTHPAFAWNTISLIIVVIVCFVGSLICIYALPYMKEHSSHQKGLGQPRFFMVLILFLGAMNGLLLANDLLYFYFFFEATTLCSFLLIGHNNDEISRKNSTLALWMNSLGGLFLLGGITLLYEKTGVLDFQGLTSQGPLSGLPLLAVALFCLAGMVKAAQLPFQGWLLGAMVAPTPTSALLHSSTMVKAGVYLIFRLSPCFMTTLLGDTIAWAGALTFVLAGALAIGQSNGKKILAYSTVSNLGLIIACIGINTLSAQLAAGALIVFHAVSKGLLFLGVGAVEQNIHSRDVEDMRGLYGRMPFTALIMVLAAASMILPPFGMLLGKWTAMEAAVLNLPVAVMLALGSAITVFYWARWAGMLLSSETGAKPTREPQPLLMRSTLVMLVVAVLALAVATPILVRLFFNLPKFMTAISGPAVPPLGDFIFYALGGLVLLGLLLGLMALFGVRKKGLATLYYSGAQTTEPGEYMGPMNKPVKVLASNYYLEGLFGEKRLTLWANLAAICLLAFLVAGVFL